jgi:hypothetical protein
MLGRNITFCKNKGHSISDFKESHSQLGSALNVDWEAQS